MVFADNDGARRQQSIFTTVALLLGTRLRTASDPWTSHTADVVEGFLIATGHAVQLAPPPPPHPPPPPPPPTPPPPPPPRPSTPPS